MTQRVRLPRFCCEAPGARGDPWRAVCSEPLERSCEKTDALRDAHGLKRAAGFSTSMRARAGEAEWGRFCCLVVRKAASVGFSGFSSVSVSKGHGFGKPRKVSFLKVRTDQLTGRDDAASISLCMIYGVMWSEEDLVTSDASYSSYTGTRQAPSQTNRTTKVYLATWLNRAPSLGAPTALKKN